MVTIYNVVWVMTPYNLLHGYECFGGALWACLHRPSEDEGRMSSEEPWYPPIRLHVPTTQKTVILILIFCIFHVLYHCLLQTNYIHVLGNKYTLLLFHIIF